MKEPEVIFEDNHLLGINKPAGWLVQADRTGDLTLLDWVKTYLKNKYDKPGEVFAGCIHRIDRPVSGVVMIAKTSKALERMNTMLAKGEIRKTYFAITDQNVNPESGLLEHSLVKNEAKNKSFVSKNPADGKLCKLEYEVQFTTPSGFTQLLIKPLTGRPHQIRVQLATMRWPIVGDLKYGSTRFIQDQSIGLHCHQMSFMHPVTKEMCAVSVMPSPDHGAFRLVKEYTPT